MMACAPAPCYGIIGKVVGPVAGGVATSCRALAGTLKEKGCLKSGGREGPVEAACGQRTVHEGKEL